MILFKKLFLDYHSMGVPATPISHFLEFTSLCSEEGNIKVDLQTKYKS